MKLIREKSKNYSLADTPISNIFIGSLLPIIPGDYVKVYLYAYMYSEINHILSNESIADALGLEIEDVLAAWTRLEELHIIKKKYIGETKSLNYDIIFVDLRESIFGSSDEENSGDDSEQRNTLGDEKIKSLFSEIEKVVGQPISLNDVQIIGSLLETLNVDPSLVSVAYAYCAERNLSISANYISGVVRDWMSKGISSEKEAMEYLSSLDIRYDYYKQIMKALGLQLRNITDAEKEVFNTWLDDYGFTLNEILDISIKGAGKDNKFSYVKAIIENEYEKKNPGSVITKQRSKKISRKDFYKNIRDRKDEELRIRCEDIYKKSPSIKTLENEIKALNLDSVSVSFSKADNIESVRNEINKKLEKKKREKKNLLEKIGYKPSDMERQYRCELCKDTGIKEDDSSCSCYLDDLSKTN